MAATEKTARRRAMRRAMRQVLPQAQLTALQRYSANSTKKALRGKSHFMKLALMR
jgi:hypothetical protein